MQKYKAQEFHTTLSAIITEQLALLPKKYDLNCIKTCFRERYNFVFGYLIEVEANVLEIRPLKTCIKIKHENL